MPLAIEKRWEHKNVKVAERGGRAADLDAPFQQSISGNSRRRRVVAHARLAIRALRDPSRVRGPTPRTDLK